MMNARWRLHGKERKRFQTTDFNTLKKQMLSNPDVNREYQALAPEYALARQLTEARTAPGSGTVQGEGDAR